MLESERVQPDDVRQTERPSYAPWLAAFGLMSLALLFVAQFRGIDPDFLWHLKTGLLYLAGQRPDLADPYSWTAMGRQWVDHEWLGEVVWGVMWDSGGLLAVRALNVCLLLLLLGLMFRLARNQGAGLVTSATLAVAGLCLAYPWYLPRLQIYSGLGLAVLLLLLQRHYAGRSGKLWLLCIFMLVLAWANLHGGGAIIAPICLAIAAGLEIIWRRGKESGWLIAGTLVASLALVVNPAGIGLPIFSLASMFDPRILKMNEIIQEWRPLDLHYRVDQLYLTWVMGLVIAGLLAWRKPPLAWLTLGLIWMGMGFSASRNFPLAAIGSLPLFAHFVSTWPTWRGGRGKVGVITALAFSFTLVWRFPALEPRGLPFTSIGVNFASARAMEALTQQAADRKLFNLYHWGGEIIMGCYPKVRVFIDGRQYLYGYELNRDAWALAAAEPGFESLLKRYDIDAVFLPPEVPLVAMLRKQPNWHVVFLDPTAVILLKDRSASLTHALER